jgi:hypothetical protein
MTQPLELNVVEADGRLTPVSFAVEQVLLAGYTGRDRAGVIAHIRELEQQLGVAPPERVPSIFVVEPALLTTAERIEVNGERTSGEAEFFLVPAADGWLIGVGSDHTDREHEAIDVAASKTMCSKVLSRLVWRYADVREHWDELQLRAWVTDDGGQRRLYQAGRLGDFLSVDNLLDELRQAGYQTTPTTVIFGGTLPLIGGFAYAPRFEAELDDPTLGRSLACSYAVVARDLPTIDRLSDNRTLRRK